MAALAIAAPTIACLLRSLAVRPRVRVAARRDSHCLQAGIHFLQHSARLPYAELEDSAVNGLGEREEVSDVQLPA